MAGTKADGKQSGITNKLRYGEDFYKRIGAIGGKKSTSGGFAWMKANGLDHKIREAGAKGGTISKRRKKEA